ncbi:MAG TPA: hypothetical protein VN813_04740 [Luteibacter sp.]|nr:hypothetical protein [Luteibacter sp.]
MGAFTRAGVTMLALAGAAPAATATTRDETSVDGLTILTLEAGDDAADIRRQIDHLLDAGTRIAVTGPVSIREESRPEGVHAWPSTNTIVLDPAAGLGIFGFDAADTEQRIDLLRQWPWADESPGPSSRARRDAEMVVPGGFALRNVSFDLSAASPSSACQAFRRKLTSSIFTSVAPSDDVRRAFRKEMRRWCQYGNISHHQAATAQFSIEPFFSSFEPRLTILTEWALLRNEDPIAPERTTYLFWAKTVGEGAGSGFSRRDGSEAYYDDQQGGLRRLLDASIHSGWGPIAPDDLLTAWPLNSTFPQTGNTHVFVCDGPGASKLFGCPRRLRLRSLYPADSTDGVVTVSLAERFIVGGSAQAGISVDNTGKVTPSFTFSLNFMRSTTDTAQSTMQLAQTRTNADTVFYRTTRWTPDVPAIYRWIKARNHKGSLAQATPLASTLNPRYEILWEVPLEANAGRKFSYHIIYEAGWNTCFNGPICATHLWPPDRSLQPKARVAWKDRLSLRMPLE